jgi:plastocyanin
MILTRRRVLTASGGFLAGVALLPTASLAADLLDIVMTGRPDGSEVWFDPIGLHVVPGQSVRWTNRDLGDSHTATAYHPDLFGRPQRIPVGAEPWDSDYLLPDESFVITSQFQGYTTTTASRTNMPGWLAASWLATL